MRLGYDVTKSINDDFLKNVVFSLAFYSLCLHEFAKDGGYGNTST